MQGEGGFVKDYRSTIDWEWFTDPNTAHLWEYIRLRANYEPSRFRGMEIGRGEFLESLSMIALRTGLSVKSVRTALEHLKNTGEVACKPTRFGMLISVVKYALYQDQTAEGGTQIGTQPAYESAGNRQGSGKEVATYKEVKKERKKRNKEERETTTPTLEEIKSFVKEEKLTIDPVRFFSFYEGQDWKTSSGYPIRDWKAKARSWQSTERQPKTEVLPDFYNADPVREKDPKLATKEEIERVRALLTKGAKKK